MSRSSPGPTGRAQADRHRRRSGDVDAERCNLIHLGKRGCNLVAVTFGHAAGDDQLGALATLVAQAEDRVDRLLAGLVDEGTRVDDDDVGLVGRIDRSCRQRQSDPRACPNRPGSWAAERLEEVGLRLTHGRPSLEVGAQAPEEGIQRVVMVPTAGNMVGRRIHHRSAVIGSDQDATPVRSAIAHVPSRRSNRSR